MAAGFHWNSCYRPGAATEAVIVIDRETRLRRLSRQAASPGKAGYHQFKGASSPLALDADP